jgi:hypothetical protein
VIAVQVALVLASGAAAGSKGKATTSVTTTSAMIGFHRGG